MRLGDLDKLAYDIVTSITIAAPAVVPYHNAVMDIIKNAPTIEAEPTLRKLLNGEWVDTDEVQNAFGIDFATGMSLFELSREAEWNKPPLNGQKITTQFRIKAEPVRHGRWVYESETLCTKSGYRCSVCRTPLWLSPDVPQAFKYCPNCGARMDGEQND